MAESGSAGISMGQWVEWLAALDLSETEANTYLSLFSGPKSKKELSKDLGIPASRTTKAVESLLYKGMVHVVPGSSDRFSASPPDWILPRLIRHKEDGLADVRRAVGELTEVFRAAASAPTERYLEIVFGVEAALASLDRLESSATREVLGFVKEPVISMDNAGAKDALRRNVTNRWIWERRFLEREDGLAAAHEWAEAGEEIRIVDQLPTKLFIIDREVAMMRVTERSEGGEQVVSLITRHPEFVATLARLFDTLWDAGVSLLSASLSGADNDVAHDEERSLLIDYLAAGLSDSSIAKRLNISQRTLTRRVQELLADLDVETRFQAGLKLGVALRDVRASTPLHAREPR
ncbi:MAG TPA: helix-turn-helix domain-containing protein [Actinomycetota bacterium]|nr:helix-turn-helix domain-containing protein [Actinomycetota bacterium]